MDDLISRKAAIEALNFGAELLRRILNEIDIVGTEREKYKLGLELVESCITEIKELPSAQTERKKDKWIEANTHTYGIYECTACKAWTYIPNEPRDYNFCPRCGADMREVGDERPD